MYMLSSYLWAVLLTQVQLIMFIEVHGYMQLTLFLSLCQWLAKHVYREINTHQFTEKSQKTSEHICPHVLMIRNDKRNQSL